MSQYAGESEFEYLGNDVNEWEYTELEYAENDEGDYVPIHRRPMASEYSWHFGDDKKYYNDDGVSLDDWFLERRKQEMYRMYAELKAELPIIIGCYGTLREGMGNNEILVRNDCDYIGTRTLKGYSLYMRGESIIPYARPDATGSIVVDLYYVKSVQALYELDCLEGHPDHYVRTPMDEGFSIYVDAHPVRTTTTPTLNKYGFDMSKFNIFNKLQGGDYSQWYIEREEHALAALEASVALRRAEINELLEIQKECGIHMTDRELAAYVSTLLSEELDG
jgi:gamma-glutamylcyclotransferase (GGCT)/AIG2-like uncharacterized protein YtfP